MLEGGEDPRFMARRMVIFASEDIGNADPQALVIATAAAAAVEHVGMPECEFALSQATIYLALAPKSKEAAKAIWAARAHVREHGAATPPPQLRSSGYAARGEGLGRGQGYDDPHAHPGHLSSQDVMPEEVAGTRFWRPDEQEAELRDAPRGDPRQARPGPLARRRGLRPDRRGRRAIRDRRSQPGGGPAASSGVKRHRG